MRRILSLLVVAACGKSPVDVTPNQPYNGTPAGAPITVKIGPAGGTAATADGAFSVTFPAGAVSQETDIVIRPLVSTAPISFGKAYRVEPQDLPLAQPVTITLQADEGTLGEYGADGVGLGYRRANGDWYGDVRSEGVAEGGQQPGFAASKGRGRVVRIVRPKTRFEREYAIIAFWRVEPTEASVNVGESRALRAFACLKEVPTSSSPPTTLSSAEPEEDDLPALPVKPSGCEYSIREATWRVNGIANGNKTLGTTTSENPTRYTAPATVPRSNPVRVTLSLFWRTKGLTKTFRDPILLTIVCPDQKGPAPAAAAIAPDCNGGPWVGRSSVEVDAVPDGPPGTLTAASNLTWERDSTSTATSAIYRPKGTVTFKFTDGCLTATPDHATINAENTHASLSVLFFGDSIVYTGQGGSEWIADVTDTCKGGSPAKLVVGGVWFIGGGTSHDSRTIADSKSASGIHSVYEFHREADCGCDGSPGRASSEFKARRAASLRAREAWPGPPIGWR